MRQRFPMNLQLFAEPAAGVAGTDPQATVQGQQPPSTTPQGQQNPAIDYAKIQTMLEGTLQAKEETALKAYFKQQGLSQQEVEQAIAGFKEQKAANQPDVASLTQQAQEAQAQAQRAQIESAAMMEAVVLGIDVKTIPYVLKMADLSQTMGQDGKINEEAMKAALNKVLEDIPALKPQQAQATGFIKVGASGEGQQTTDEALKKAFGL